MNKMVKAACQKLSDVKSENVQLYKETLTLQLKLAEQIAVLCAFVWQLFKDSPSVSVCLPTPAVASLPVTMCMQRFTLL